MANAVLSLRFLCAKLCVKETHERLPNPQSCVCLHHNMVVMEEVSVMSAVGIGAGSPLVMFLCVLARVALLGI